MRKNLKWAAAAAIGGVIESWGVAAFSSVVALVTGTINAILAYDTGLPYYQVVMVFAVTFGGIGVGVFLISTALLQYLKRRREKEEAAEREAAVTQNVNANPVASVNQTFNFGSTAPQPPQQTGQEFRPPVLEPSIGTGVRRVIVEKLTLEVTDEPRESMRLQAALAEFFRGADGSTEHYVDVLAITEFYSADGEFRRKVSQTFWRRLQSGKHAANFSAGTTRELIVAYVADDKVIPYAGRWRKRDSFPIAPYVFEFNREDEPLAGKNFLVRIKLIGTTGTKQVLNEVFEYDLSLEPSPTFKRREAEPILELGAPNKANGESYAKRTYKIERLREFIQQSVEMKIGGYMELTHENIGLMHRQTEFTKRLKFFLTTHWGESAVKDYEERGIIVLEELLTELIG